MVSATISMSNVLAFRGVPMYLRFFKEVYGITYGTSQSMKVAMQKLAYFLDVQDAGLYDYGFCWGPRGPYSLAFAGDIVEAIEYPCSAIDSVLTWATKARQLRAEQSAYGFAAILDDIESNATALPIKAIYDVNLLPESVEQMPPRIAAAELYSSLHFLARRVFGTSIVRDTPGTVLGELELRKPYFNNRMLNETVLGMVTKR